MPATLKFRGGDTAQEDLRTGAANELTVDTEAKELRLHDGSTPGGKAIGGGGPTTPPPVLVPLVDAGYGRLPDNIIKHSGNITVRAVNEILYIPWVFTLPTVVSGLGVRSSSVADGASVDTRFGIWEQDPTTGYPGNLLFGSAPVDCSVLNSFRNEILPTPLTLHGTYWVGVKSDSATYTMFNTSTSSSWGSPVGLKLSSNAYVHPTTAGHVGALTSNPTMSGLITKSDIITPFYT